jgi:hypothetical protein
MIDDPLSLLMQGIWLLAAGMYPLGYMFGTCSKCCCNYSQTGVTGVAVEISAVDLLVQSTRVFDTDYLPNGLLRGIVIEKRSAASPTGLLDGTHILAFNPGHSVSFASEWRKIILPWVANCGDTVLTVSIFANPSTQPLNRAYRLSLSLSSTPAIVERATEQNPLIYCDFEFPQYYEQPDLDACQTYSLNFCREQERLSGLLELEVRCVNGGLLTGLPAAVTFSDFPARSVWVTRIYQGSILDRFVTDADNRSTAVIVEDVIFTSD